MDGRSGRGNRIGLGLTGTALLTGGIAALSCGLGAYGAAVAGRPLPGETIADYLTGPWVHQFAVAGPVVALALVGTGWLVRQGLAVVARTKQLRPERRADRKMLRAAVDGLVAAARTYPGVHRARFRLVGSARSPWLAVTLGCAAGADLAALRGRVHDDVATVREALEIPALPVVIRFRVPAGVPGPGVPVAGVPVPGGPAVPAARVPVPGEPGVPVAGVPEQGGFGTAASGTG